MRRTHLLATTVLVVCCATTPCRGAIALFNGEDLSGFTVRGSVPWVVEDGILRNTAPANAHNFLKHNARLPGSDFILETRVKVVQGMRFRLHAAFDQLYIGNEGYWRQFEMYGNRLHDVRQVGDDSYVLNQWYDLRLEVDADDHVKLFKNDILTHTARVSSLPDLQVIFGAGDGWSPGMIEMETLQYTRSVPAPSSLACMTGLFAVAMVARWWRRR